MPRINGPHWGEKPLRVITGLTTHATVGTRKSIPHGFTDLAGNAATPTIAIPVVTGVNGDVDDVTQIVVVVSIDATNVVVKSNAASTPFTLYVAG